MKVLITGATGFLGRNLLKYIEQHDIDKKYDLYLLTSKPIDNYKCINHSGYRFNKQNFFEQGLDNIDVLIHCGSFTPKKGNELNNIEGSVKNIENTNYLINNLPSIPRKIIYISSISVYDLNMSDKISENTLTIPDSLYGQSKLFCENLLKEYSLENNVQYQIFRMGVIYGSGDRYCEGLIPHTIKRLINNENPVIYNGGKEIKSFINVYDCCRVIYAAINSNVNDEIVNVVSSDTISVRELVDEIINISGRKIIPENITSNKNYKNTIYNPERMIKNFGKNIVDYKTGIKEEYEYFLGLLQGVN